MAESRDRFAPAGPDLDEGAVAVRLDLNPSFVGRELYRVRPSFHSSAAMQMRGWAAVGIVINVVTGVLFFVGAPDQYIDNPAWWATVLFLFVAIVDIPIFETRRNAF